ncbi:MAG TPA: biotin/lipoyl-containing protein [Aliidongia sp.]|uniref:acetyl-CoA carboxylase biotin carboxyl carrier protein subunit n=1 Tax=Aliidongia sp. TaxID=1914230 RepID=UPI002DDCF8CC|nr:biotin/lipoyl-containing protein [Aliidongia sp.]HEV2677547.1 biotin/lipoyl-containing protein [Aliidongia sp.]
MSYDLQRGADRVSLGIVARRPALSVAIEGLLHQVEEIRHGADDFELRVDGRTFRGRRTISSDEIQIRLDGQTFVFRRLHGIRGIDTSAATGDEVRADMPGTVVACHTEAGAAVAPGDRLVTIESMKLQMTVSAPRAGTIARIHVAENVTFERGAVLVSLVPIAGEEK